MDQILKTYTYYSKWDISSSKSNRIV